MPSAGSVASPAAVLPRRQFSSRPAAATPEVSAGYQAEKLPVRFRYIGPTALTVRGPISGRIYRFARTADTIPVDERDAPFLASVPRLRRA